MKYINYLLGFSLAALVIYILGSLVSWNLDPGKWSSFWRFWCLGWVILVGHISGLYVKEEKKKKR